MKDYYNILNIDYISSNDEIKKAYRKLALKYHPDRNHGDNSLEEKFKEISEAYEVLSEPVKRREYDIKYKQYYRQESENKNTQKEEITSSTFLFIFIDIKKKILQNINSINRQGLFYTLDEVLSDVNIKFLVNRNEININGQIIDNVLFCCLLLTEPNSILIRNKLLILANKNQNLIQKISNYKSAQNNNSSAPSNNSNSGKKKSFPHKSSNDSSNIGCILFVIVSIIVAIVISNGDKKTTTDYSPSSSQQNGDLNNEFILDTSATKNNVSIQPESKQLSPEEMLEQEKLSLIEEGWTETDVKNGQLPDCYNFIPKRGRINNKLAINVGGGTDVAIKVMNFETEKCIRYVFINSRTTFEIKNIPEGIYYLKIAYGKNWYSKVENGQCIGKFLRSPMYEKGSDVMDFNVQQTYDGYNIPSFQLQLDVISTNNQNTFDSQNISENEFNQ